MINANLNQPSIGEAINTELIVPMMIPISIIIENPFIISPPKKNSTKTANNVVIEVIIVLDKVSETDSFITSFSFINYSLLLFL